MLFAALALAGFTRTFYLHGLFAQPTPAPLIVVHALAMTGWVVLYAVQTALISARQIRWHKWLGWAGIAFAALIPPLAFMAEPVIYPQSDI